MITKGFTLLAAGPGPWHRVDTYANPFNVSMNGSISGGGVLTWQIQHAQYANAQDFVATDAISRAATVATVVFPKPHGLKVGDSIIVQAAGAPFDGVYDVATTADTVTITYTVANSGLTAATAGAKITKLHVMTHATATALTTSADAVYISPVSFVRANITAFTNGALQFTVNQAG